MKNVDFGKSMLKRSIKRPVNRLGITLVELLVAVSILVLIAAFVVPRVRSVSDDSRAYEAANMLSSAIKRAGANSMGMKKASAEYANSLTDRINGRCLVLEENPNFSGGVTKIQFGTLKHARELVREIEAVPFPLWAGFVPPITEEMEPGTLVSYKGERIEIIEFIDLFL